MQAMPCAILGMGVVSSIGMNVKETALSLFEQPPLPAPTTRFESQLGLPVFEVAIDVTSLRQESVCTILLQQALDEALNHANITVADLKQLRVGVCIGTTVACQINNIPFYADLRAGKIPDTAVLPHFVQGIPAEYIAARYGTNGPTLTVANACTSGADALGIASLWLQNDLCDIAIAGGVDEINRVPVLGFHALGITSLQPCAPFDAARSGLNLGEGAGVMILGSEAFSQKQGIRPKFSIREFGRNSDAFHITNPEPTGAMLEKSIRDACGNQPDTLANIAFVNAHGTGTQANDQVEATVFKKLWDGKIPFMSTKAMTGHTLGAAGAVEAIFSCIMLEKRRAVKSWRFETAGADIACAPISEHTAIDGHLALSTSLAFGGGNTAILLERNTP